MKQKIIPIKGMHCRSCEILIGDELGKIPGVKRVSVNYKKGSAEIYYKGKIPNQIIEESVNEAGYEVGEEKKELITKNPSDYKDLFFSFIILIALYFILKKTGLINFSIGASGSYSNLPVVLLVGLTAGFSTCMALVGGLVLGISARYSEQHPEATSFQKFRPHLFFNLGRIVSFFLLGGLIGILGSAFQLSGVSLGILTIIVGLVMIALGLQLTGIFPWLNTSSLTLPASISRLLGIKNQDDQEYSHKNSFVLGGLSFFLPCGFTQAMQLYAISTGSFLTGALIMGIFAIGTAPGLLGVGGLTSVIKGVFAQKFFKFAGLTVIILALINISNGYNLTGWKISLSDNSWANSRQDPQDPNVKIENGFQVIRMTQNTTGYSPNNFIIKAGIPSKWVIIATDPRSCSASIISSKLGIRKILRQGENVIEFIPKEASEAKFSCLMGMYRGNFTIIKNNNPPKDAKQLTPTSNNQQPTAGPQQSDKSTLRPVTQPDGSIKYEAGADPSSQLIKTTYTLIDDIQPSNFEVKAGIPVLFEVDVQEDGQGCMSTIVIPGLVDQPELLEKGKTLTFEFTPEKPGTYEITCAMGVPRGELKVN